MNPIPHGNIYPDPVLRMATNHFWLNSDTFRRFFKFGLEIDEILSSRVTIFIDASHLGSKYDDMGVFHIRLFFYFAISFRKKKELLFGSGSFSPPQLFSLRTERRSGVLLAARLLSEAPPK